MTNQRGQSAIEGAFVAAMIGLLCSTLLISTYLGFANIWVRYQTEQLSLCLLQEQSRHFCRSEVQARLKDFLPYGRPVHIDGRLSPESAQAHVHWRLEAIQFKVASRIQIRYLHRKMDLH